MYHQTNVLRLFSRAAISDVRSYCTRRPRQTLWYILPAVSWVIARQIWDKDFLGSNTHVAGCRFPMSAATVSRAAGARVPVPSWFQVWK